MILSNYTPDSSSILLSSRLKKPPTASVTGPIFSQTKNVPNGEHRRKPDRKIP